VARAHAAAVINGTFFSKDAQKRVMGNMVRGGAFVKYSQWENAGTTFGLLPGNRPVMVTARAEGKPDWQSHQLSITCGPRLLMNGQPWLHPADEGFRDSHVLGVAGRSALGYSRDGRWLYLVSFDSGVSLAQEARAMKALGAWEAMNLDGGASRALAVRGRTVVSPGRALTNVLAVYDGRVPAPLSKVKASNPNLSH
jgi:exopolysaccharide biosynthesis protein